MNEMNKATFDYRTGEIPSRNSNFRRVYILYLLFGCCTLFYYFGELVDLARWEALRWDFLYGVHDIHRLLFLAPIVYAGYSFGVRAAIIITLVATMIFLPRALFVSPFPDPLLRMVFFTVVAGTIGTLTGIIRNKSERQTQLETLLESERDKCFEILARMEDGVILTAPDCKVRFVNPSMIRDFGEGIGSHCYEYLHNLSRPCEVCKLPNVIDGEIVRWEYTFPDGRTYEVMASPYIDSDGMVCQLATFRNITHRKKVKL